MLPEGNIRLVFFVIVSAAYYIGYTCQCVVTKSAQSCVTNDPKQRPLFAGNIVIPMTADCADYETYRSGKYVPGLMGTLFSFVDKIVSSFAPMIAGVVFAAVGFADHNPVEGDIVTWELRVGTAFLAFGVIIFGLICNLIAMKFYPLTKEKMAEIQDEVAKIKAAALAE